MTYVREHALPSYPSRSNEFPLQRDPKLRQAGSTPKHSRPATQVWSAGACAELYPQVNYYDLYNFYTVNSKGDEKSTRVTFAIHVRAFFTRNF